MLVAVSLNLVRVIAVANPPEVPVIPDIPQKPALSLGLLVVNKLMLKQPVAITGPRSMECQKPNPKQGMELGWIALHEPPPDASSTNVINDN